MNKLILFVLCVLSVTCRFVSAKEKVVVCYYGTWATYRHGNGQFDVENINTDLCTHIVYTFVGINNQGTVISLDPWLDLPDNWGRDNFRKFNALKKYKPNLKTLLAVGGWNEGSAKYSVFPITQSQSTNTKQRSLGPTQSSVSSAAYGSCIGSFRIRLMAASPTLRQNFIKSALDMVLTYGFDGFDLDWEYPNRRDSVNGKADIDNFTQLTKELRAEFDKYGLLLTAAVSSVGSVAVLSYDIPAFTKYVDLVNLMTYDMYGAWDSVTGHNAPLHKGQGDENVSRENVFTVDVALEYWLQQGCPPEKLVLGLPLYGRTFQLSNTNNNGVRALSSGAGIAGPWTATNGLIGYNEFCQKLKTETWDVRYDSLAKVPYAVQGRNWVSYDDPSSLAAKIEHAMQYNIAGAMIWSIETDDFRGLCAGDFPMLRAINEALGKYSGQQPTVTTTSSSTTTTTTTKPSQTTTTTTTRPSQTSTTTTTSRPVIITTSAPSTAVCKTEGFNVNPEDCHSFYVCIHGGSGDLVPYLLQCPAGLHWDPVISVCNYSHQANCV